MTRDFIQRSIFVLILLLNTEFIHGQDNIEYLEAIERFNYDSKVDDFRLTDLPSGRELQTCQKRNRPFEWKRNKGCRTIVRRIETELKDELAGDNYSDLGKSIIYIDLFRVGKYFRAPNLSLLDSSALLYCRRIKSVSFPDAYYLYQAFLPIYLRQTIWQMWGEVENRHRQEWYDIREKHYLAHLTPGATCDNGTEWIEPNYHVHLAMLMYQKGYYTMTSEFLHYEGLNVGNTYWSESRVNSTELRKQFFYTKAIRKLYSQDELEEMMSGALSNIHIIRSSYKTLAYSYFGFHLVKIHLQMAQKETEALSNDGLLCVARRVLNESVIFNELKK